MPDVSDVSDETKVPPSGVSASDTMGAVCFWDQLCVDAAAFLCAVPGDLNGDGIVNGADLGIMLGGWDNAGPTDLDGNGKTDGGDLGLLLGNWGGGPP